ncbi:TPA: hypothetical protein ACY362_001388 [Pasteurella multocida]|uniref:hypothetical protein n=1 Tax=Pasteurella multocida TaxID=747 RepID=UPI000518973A|nr:hypothetical protein [Pasteurella multocida]ARB76687.1 hypothetical protein A6J57_10805 [Pasteurella multocida]NMR23509.1 hypothetical protein [Pasteurella multocida]NMR51522.1 hypothetical protein [Pasteurella multocida]NMR61462.1 hypothetical protein [Pasteurella multocida]OBP30357.1 hypothetical protein A0R67_02925 [Pasteurella multocida subsp. multocida]
MFVIYKCFGFYFTNFFEKSYRWYVFNQSPGGACWMCYSHSRYYAEVPDKTMIDSHGNVIENPAYKDFAEKWEEVDIKNPVNPSLPKLVRPANSDGGVLNDKAF